MEPDQIPPSQREPKPNQRLTNSHPVFRRDRFLHIRPMPAMRLLSLSSVKPRPVDLACPVNLACPVDLVCLVNSVCPVIPAKAGISLPPPEIHP